MNNHPITITESDRERLYYFLNSEFADAVEPKSYLIDLEGELQRATVVAESEVPHDVVTMNSTVVLRDMDSDDDVETYTLVYPDEADIASNRLSILAPIGTAILGSRAGDVVSWRVPDGHRSLRIDEVVFQPERDAALQE